MNKVLPVALLTAGLAWADMEGSQPALWVQDAGKAAPCTAKTGMCFKSAAATTVMVDAKGAPKFSRGALAATNAKAASNAAWSIDVGAQLRKPAISGNTLFVFFDLADPTAIKRQENTALFQAPVKAGKQLAVRLNLSNEDGFRAGHTYRIRIAQLLGGREVVLAEGDFSLL